MLHTFEEKIAAEPILPAWVRDFPSTPFNPSPFLFFLAPIQTVWLLKSSECHI